MIYSQKVSTIYTEHVLENNYTYDEVNIFYLYWNKENKLIKLKHGQTIYKVLMQDTTEHDFLAYKVIRIGTQDSCKVTFGSLIGGLDIWIECGDQRKLFMRDKKVQDL